MALSHCGNKMQMPILTEWDSQCQLFNFVVDHFGLPRHATIVREFIQKNGPEVQRLFLKRANQASRAPEFRSATVAERASRKRELWEQNPVTPYNIDNSFARME